MQGIFSSLAEKYSAINFFLVEAENVPEVSEALSVVVVPTFSACIGDKVVGKLEGANPSELIKLIKNLDEYKSASASSSIADGVAGEYEAAALDKRLVQLINMAPVVLFMKGTPAEPKCGFSRQIVEILKTNEVGFASFNILSDEAVRTRLKTFSDWPTYPQLYVNGSLAGGLDIVKEMAAGGDLKSQLGISEVVAAPAVPSLEERIKALINKASVMVFIKGTPEVPKCGFSRSIITVLNDQGISYEYFDILTDENIRAGIKIYSDWPTYPQLYVNGTLVGGLDIVNEMVAQGDFKHQLGI